jgi:hypothetical protein
VEKRKPERMPTSIKWAMAGVWFQVLTNGLFAWWLLGEVESRLDHGQAVPDRGIVVTGLALSWVIAAVLAVCGVLATRRLNAVRITIMVVECLAFLIALVNSFTTGTVAVLGLVLAASIGWAMDGERGREWFRAPGGPPTLRLERL